MYLTKIKICREKDIPTSMLNKFYIYYKKLSVHELSLYLLHKIMFDCLFTITIRISNISGVVLVVVC